MFYKKIKMVFFLILAVIIIIAIGAYRFNQTGNISGELTKVYVGMKWLHQAQFTGNYVAKEKGFYESNGLDVQFSPFSYDSTSIDKVARGEAMFGVAGADEVIIARSKGIPIKAIGVIYKINPVCAYSIKDSMITKPQDFIGKRVGIEKGVNVEYLYNAMMAKLEIDRSKTKEVAIGYSADEILNGEVDVSTGYLINEPQLLVESGKEVNIILVANYGVNMYADVIFTTDDNIKNNPKIVKNFLDATLDGWKYSIENQEESVDIVMKYATNTSRQHQKNMLISSIPLIQTGKSPLGVMQRSEWAQAENILWEQKIIDKRVDVEEVFTEEFYK